jgi:hypothetical protein
MEMRNSYILPKPKSLRLNRKHNNMTPTEFYLQLEEDLDILKENLFNSDPKLDKPEYAFNYWTLSKMYNIDDEYIFDLILEGNDKGIDCYAHYPEAKKLFLIQNKYYAETTSLSPKEVSHFLTTSLSSLKAGDYTKSRSLQDLFTAIKDDPDYNIYFHLYLTNESGNSTIETTFTQFNLENKAKTNKALIEAKLFKLPEIIELYYGKQHKEQKKFSCDLTTNNHGMLMQIRPESSEYHLPKNFLEAFYVMTPIKDVFEMFRKASKDKYELFAENIREYLGKTPVNDAIRRTLEGEPEERINFFYYNNGITIISDKTTKGKMQVSLAVNLQNPQIVNGCQTVSTIYEVLSNYAKIDPSLTEFKDVYVMVKILVKNAEVERKKPEIYNDIVRFTNKQNGLTEKAFAANTDEFTNMQKGFKDRGFLLLVKGGNMQTAKKEYADKKKLNELMFNSKKRTSSLNLEISRLSDLFIPIEKLLQVFLAYRLDGYFAYTKKPDLLDASSTYHLDYALKMQDSLTYDQILALWLIYKKAESERRNSEDGKVPIPLYVIGFLSAFIKNKEDKPENFKKFATEFFNLDQATLERVYGFLCDLTSSYKMAMLHEKKVEYNEMIKLPIDNEILWREVEKLSSQRANKDIKKVLEELNY